MKSKNWMRLIPSYFLVIILVLVAAIGTDRGITVLKENEPVYRKNCIIVDPGHGGIDGGATSCTGVLESNLNLEIGLRLNDFLHLLGYKTVMTRTTDTSIYTSGNTIAAQKVSDLKERVKIVNGQSGGILVSIHQNTYPNNRYAGAQVFYSNQEDSKKLAETVQSGLKFTGKRSVKKGEGIYLLNNISNPGILIECGFLSNPTEEANLRNEQYQKKLCAFIGLSICQFLTP